ncbi:hypothetical protein ACYFX5_09095 [Bremerella sp. T1]|uniref:hypothetical protein n=1 Tax=Bremerella sp. TYQ1 TaxID=3119568 RepID=UPI001CCA0E7D|nr:hypothetical protein [Bremerella volcania]UBM38408.1 hypothetical protein LA756_11030 [Bremerella volcania]
MKIDLEDRESIVFLGKRIINDAGRKIRLVVLNEPGEQIQVDRRKFPKKGKAPPPIPKATAI